MSVSAFGNAARRLPVTSSGLAEAVMEGIGIVVAAMRSKQL
jgi:hypothetical protein